MIFNVAMLRHHEGFNPFTNRREDILTDEGEKAFIAADAKNADRLKAIDAFLVSSTFVNDIAPYFGGGR